MAAQTEVFEARVAYAPMSSFLALEHRVAEDCRRLFL